MLTQKLLLLLLLASFFIGLSSTTCNKHEPFVAPAQTISDTLSIILTQPWTATGITLLKGQAFAVKASGKMNWFTGSSCTTCISSPDGSPCQPVSTPFSYPDLPCWSLIGGLANGNIFEVGDSYSGVADTTGELYLGVNDNNYGDNTGSWIAVVTTTPPTCNTEADTYVPQMGDVPNLTAAVFQPQQASNWCWAATARLLMLQAAPATTVNQCDIVSRATNNACCANSNSSVCNFALGLGGLQSILQQNGFTAMKNFGTSIPTLPNTPTEAQVIQQLAVLKRPIAFEMNWSAAGDAGAHYEVIYGYYYVGNDLYVRIWDPRPPIAGEQYPLFRCNLFSQFPQPITENNGGQITIHVVDYVYDVQH